MNLRDLQARLLQDMKRSWAKTALLGVLLLVGLVFWLPPLFKSLIGNSDRSIVDTSAKTKVLSVRSSTPTKPDAAGVRGPASEEFSWTTAEEWLRSDPAAKSAEMGLVRQNPFRLDRDQFPPPILFESEPPRDADRSSVASVSTGTEASVDIKGAVLTSTIVSRARRAAMINDRLYSEGSLFKFDGQIFEVERILPNRVKLTQEGVVYYLTIPSRYEISRETTADLEHPRKKNGD